MINPTQAVLDALKHIELLASTPEGLCELNRPSLGICSTILIVLVQQLGGASSKHDEALSLWNNTYVSLFQEWEGFSGNEAYPIKVEPFTSEKSGEPCVGPADQFNHSVIMYGHTAYGEARLHLVTYLRERYEQAQLELEVAQGTIWLDVVPDLKCDAYRVICDRSNNPEPEQ